MVAKRWALAATALLACGRNEAASLAGNNLARSEASEYEREHERHEHALDILMKNMTLNTAMSLLGQNTQATPKVVALVKQALGQAEAAGRSSLRASGKQDPAADVLKATETLNDMIYEVQTKYEVEHRKCCEYERTKRFMLEETSQDIALFNAQAAAGRSGVLAAQTQLTMAAARVPQLNEALKQNIQRCENSQKVLADELKAVLNDIDALSNVLDMTDCKKKDAKMMLIGTVARVQSKGNKEALEQGLREAEEEFAQEVEQAAQGNRSLSHAAAHSVTAGRHVHFNAKDEAHQPAGSPAQPGAVGPAKADALQPPPGAGKSFDPFKLAPAAGPGGGPCSRPSADAQKKFKCAVAEEATCLKITDRFLKIQMATLDKRDMLREERERIKKTCDATTEDIRNQLSGFQAQVMDQQTRLARWTKMQNNADEQGRLKTVERQAMEKEFRAMTETCHNNYASFEAQECGLRKIRGELAKLKDPKLQPYFQDCDVSKWTPSACSVTCGGGTQRLSRSVITAPKNGVKCLPLSRMDNCNMQSCPINCKLADWQTWSACTAKCGGGLMQRARDVLVRPRNGGQVCADTSETRSCNLQSCDADCRLNEWSAWSSCSKQCNNGRQRRIRTVAEPARGTGKCPGEKDGARLQYQACNTQSCPQDLQCRSSNLDIALLLDGSSGQGEAGWNALRSAAAMLVQGLGGQGGAMVSVLTFAGPEYWGDVSKCTGEAGGALDMAKDCKLKWVSHFTNDAKKLSEDVEKLAWPQGSRLTSTALGLAEGQLALSRKEAADVIIVITSGAPLSLGKTEFMSKKLRHKARVFYVTVGPNAPLHLYRTWSSEPDDENVRVVPDFITLVRKQTIDGIISDICPTVAQRFEYQMVGQYKTIAGQPWGSNPPTFSCVEACAAQFGAGTYRCSTQPGTLNYQAFASGWADATYCTTPVSDTWKVNSRYNCGSRGCAYSAWVQDHCPNSVNYCWRFQR